MQKTDERPAGRLSRVLAAPGRKIGWNDNPLLQNSIFLAIASLFTAGLGFCFWTVVARLYSPDAVGIATSLISTTSLIAYLSLFGLNSSLVRYLPRSEHPNTLITQAVAGVTGVSIVIGLLAVAALPLIAPRLAFVGDRPVVAMIFVASGVLAAINLLTDAVFIAGRKSQYNILADGVLQGLAKLALPVFLVGFGSLGIFGATGIASVVAVAASFYFMHRIIGSRPDFSRRHTALTRQLRYSSSTYVSSVLNLVPVLVVPLIVLEHLGAAQAGFYYVAFQVTNLINAFATAVGEAVFAEGSHDASQFHRLMRRAAKLLAISLLPTAAVVAVFSSTILSIFGPDYRRNAELLLLLLAANAVFVGLNTWASFALKILGVMRPLIISNVIYAVAVVGFALMFSDRGLSWTGFAWIIGTAASAIYAALAVRRHTRSNSAPSDV